jgi:hypothetical protein
MVMMTGMPHPLSQLSLTYIPYLHRPNTLQTKAMPSPLAIDPSIYNARILLYIAETAALTIDNNNHSIDISAKP